MGACDVVGAKLMQELMIIVSVENTTRFGIFSTIFVYISTTYFAFLYVLMHFYFLIYKWSHLPYLNRTLNKRSWYCRYRSHFLLFCMYSYFNAFLYFFCCRYDYTGMHF